MTNVDIAVLRRRMLSGEPFTYTDMCRLFTGHMRHRSVDRAIKRLRKSRKIALSRDSWVQVWSAVKQQEPAR